MQCVAGRILLIHRFFVFFDLVSHFVVMKFDQRPSSPVFLLTFFQTLITNLLQKLAGTNMFWFRKILKLLMEILLRLYNNCLEELLMAIVSIKFLVLYSGSFYFSNVLFLFLIKELYAFEF